MELQMMDYLFIGFIAAVVVGGIICLMIFLPKEHELEEKTADCYRIIFRHGVYTIGKGKANLGENIYSIGSNYSYIKKIPFPVECFADDDESGARAAAQITVHFPETMLNVFAPTFCGLDHDSICETISETASVALGEVLKDVIAGKTDEDAAKESFKKTVKEKLAIFGAEMLSISEFRTIRS